MAIYDQITAELETRKDRSAWGKGVNAYALELVEELKERAEYEGRDPESEKECREWMLNGAQDWEQYSWGGSSLIYNADIAERLCCPSELKKTRNGERRPNNREEWLDTQARALYQAASRVVNAYRGGGAAQMKKYTLKALRELVRLGVAEDYTNKPAENLYTLRRLEKVGYSSGVYGINGGLVEDTETGQLYAIIGRCSNLFILF